MEIKSIYRHAHISAFKAREVTRAIQGLPVSAALDLLAYTPRKAAGLVAKTLKSAVANAENNAELKVETLVVKEAVVGEGPTLKRFQPKARGSAGPIRKRTSHIRIVLTDEIKIEEPRRRRGAKPGGRRKGGRRPAAGAAGQPAAGAEQTPAAATAEDKE